MSVCPTSKCVNFFVDKIKLMYSDWAKIEETSVIDLSMSKSRRQWMIFPFGRWKVIYITKYPFVPFCPLFPFLSLSFRFIPILSLIQSSLTPSFTLESIGNHSRITWEPLDNHLGITWKSLENHLGITLESLKIT